VNEAFEDAQFDIEYHRDAQENNPNTDPKDNFFVVVSFVWHPSTRILGKIGTMPLHKHNSKKEVVGAVDETGLLATIGESHESQFILLQYSASFVMQ
jgi:hypothetical protein